jgi:hypothetical protein
MASKLLSESSKLPSSRAITDESDGEIGEKHNQQQDANEKLRNESLSSHAREA